MLQCNNYESPHLNPLPWKEERRIDLDDLARIRRQIFQSLDSAISYRILLDFIQRTASRSGNDLNKRFQTP